MYELQDFFFQRKALFFQRKADNFFPFILFVLFVYFSDATYTLQITIYILLLLYFCCVLQLHCWGPVWLRGKVFDS